MMLLVTTESVVASVPWARTEKLTDPLLSARYRHSKVETEPVTAFTLAGVGPEYNAGVVDPVRLGLTGIGARFSMVAPPLFFT